jgi:hypothetical protein
MENLNDKTIKEEEKKSPLDIAIEKGRKEIEEILRNIRGKIKGNN